MNKLRHQLKRETKQSLNFQLIFIYSVLYLIEMYHSYPFLLIPCIVKTAYSRKKTILIEFYIYPNLIENSRLLSGNCLRMIDVSRDKRRGFSHVRMKRFTSNSSLG